MAELYYYNRRGTKRGPFRGTEQEQIAQLQELVDRGLITAKTRIDDGTGRTYRAGSLKGLTFPERMILLPVPVPQPKPSSLLTASETPSETNPASVVIAVVLVLAFVCAFIPLPLPRPCIMCGGDGKLPWIGTCSTCNGTGVVFTLITVLRYTNGGTLGREL